MHHKLQSGPKHGRTTTILARPTSSRYESRARPQQATTGLCRKYSPQWAQGAGSVEGSPATRTAPGSSEKALLGGNHSLLTGLHHHPHHLCSPRTPTLLELHTHWLLTKADVGCLGEWCCGLVGAEPKLLAKPIPLLQRENDGCPPIPLPLPIFLNAVEQLPRLLPVALHHPCSSRSRRLQRGDQIGVPVPPPGCLPLPLPALKYSSSERAVTSVSSGRGSHRRISLPGTSHS